MSLKMKAIQSNQTTSEGGHKATLMNVTAGNGLYGKTIKFSFLVNDDDNRPTISGIAGASRGLTSSGKLFKWVYILSNGDLKIGDEPDLTDYIGTNCEILVKNSEKDGVVYSNVNEIVKNLDRF